MIGDKKGHIDLIVFHRLLTDSNCRILIDELKEWCEKEKIIENNVVDYYKFFQIWWEDNINSDMSMLPNPNKVTRHSDGTEYVKLNGESGITKAYEKIQSTYRKKALEAGHNEYFNVEALFLYIIIIFLVI